MSTKLRGKLQSSEISDFTGYRVLVSYLEKIDVSDGESSFIPARQETTPDSATGSFAIDLPDAPGRQGPVLVQAISGTGIPSATRVLPDTGPFTNIRLPVQLVTTTTVTTSTDITLGTRIKFSGRAIDKQGRSAPPGITVVIWASVQEGDAPTPVSVSMTSQGGYFSDAWPADSFVSAHAVISGGKPVSIHLEKNHLPLRMILVLDELPTANEKPDDCDCVDQPPRAPDPIDVAANPAAFSTDPLPCVDFTVPNRTVEEVTYQGVVRTTQPEIKGSPILNPRNTLPQKLLDKLTTLARSRPAENLDIDDKAAGTVVTTAVAGRTTVMARTTSISELLAVDTDSIRLMEGLLAKAKTLVPGVSLDSDIITNARPADEVAENILNERIKSKTPIYLEPSVAVELARDKVDLTPRRLLLAEHTSIVRRFRSQVDSLHAHSAGRFVLTEQKQLAWDETSNFGQSVSIAHGHILTFKQVWRADGYSLGDLLYSLPLAPGQQKRVSILDWSMDQVASRRASRTAVEELRAGIAHDRDIDDIIRASLSEHMNAESHADVSAVGGGIAGFVGGLVFGGAGGVSSAGSTASQTSGRHVAGTALNKVRDRTAQSASAVRSQRSTVVQETRQGEAVTAQTEVVGNYNHCHALTIEYFEVLRHFQVSQEIAQVQECLFIPFSVTSFNREKAARWKDALKRFIRNRAYLEAFDSNDRVLDNWEHADFPPGRYADDVVKFLEGEFYMSLRIPKPADADDDSFVEANWAGYKDNNLLWEEPQTIFERYLGVTVKEQRQKIWDERIAPGIAQRVFNAIRLKLVNSALGSIDVSVDATMVSTFRQNGRLLISLQTNLGPIAWTRAEIARVRLTLPLPGLTDDMGFGITVESGTLNYRTDYFAHQLCVNRRVNNDLFFNDDVELMTPLNLLEKRNPRERDRKQADQLVAYLNEHVEFFHRCIWFAMDPNRRFLLLDGFVAPDAGGRSVASVVENRVIGIVGNSLVMPVAPGLQLDPTYVFAESTPEDLRHLYSTDAVPSLRVSVPTSGVFAEAVMGKCNSCEVIDDTKFWRWEDAPIPDLPTEIAPLSTNSRRSAAPSLAPDAFPESIVRFQDAPTAPAPTGLAAAVQALGINNIFKDLTGVALNQTNASEALAASLSAAQSFAEKGADLAQQRFQNKELDRTLAQIKSARDKKLITGEQAQDLTDTAIRSAIGAKKPDAEKPTDSEEVKKNIDRMSKSPNGTLKVSNPEGSVEVEKKNGRAPGDIDVSVKPTVVFIKQTSPQTCWAAGATMMMSWRDNKTYGIDEAIQSLGGAWFNKLQQNQSLTSAEFRALMAKIGLIEEGPASYLPIGIAQLLSKGPLVEIGDDGVESNMLTHVRLIVGINGNNDPDKTRITLVDADKGSQTIPFAEFDQRHGASDVVSSGLGIFHF